MYLLLIRSTIPRNILQSTRLRIRLRVLNYVVEHLIRVVNEKVGVGMALLKRLRQGSQARIPVQNHLALGLNRIPIIVLVQGERGEVDRRHGEEEEVPRACLVDLIEQPGVASEDGVVQGSVIEPPAIPDIVNADEEREQRILGCPGCVFRVRAVAWEELELHLVFEGEHGGRVGRHEGGVDGCAAVGEVVSLDEGGVVGCGEEVYPVGAVGGCVTTVNASVGSDMIKVMVCTGMVGCRKGLRRWVVCR